MERRRSVKRLAKYCPNLKHLDVSHCGNLNWKSLANLVESCPRLQHLVLAYCGSVNNKALGQIAGSPYGETQGLRFLKTLDISGCNQVTDAGLQMLQKCYVRALRPFQSVE
jgi:hypothetical protein